MIEKTVNAIEKINTENQKVFWGDEVKARTRLRPI
jgi:hypothetical protein